MKSNFIPGLIILLVLIATAQASITILGGSAAVIGSFIFLGIRCKIYECCNDPKWFLCDNATNALSEMFENKFYGQHIAAKSLLSVIDGYCSRSKQKSATPWKAVVLSLHGPTGVGKSFVSTLIASALFKEGMKSNFVHYFDLATDLRSEEDQDLLHNWILGNASVCPNQLFIFNEIDKADLKFSITLDKLHKFLDHGASEQGIDLTNLIFLFIGNLGTLPLTEDITERYRRHERREDISGRELELLLKRAAYDHKAGLYKSSIVKKQLIDAFVPFLPLERHHVELCVRAELQHRYHYEDNDGITRYRRLFNAEEEEKVIQDVVDQLEFEPDDESGDERFFAVTGCKEVQRIVQKVVYLKQST